MLRDLKLAYRAHGVRLFGLPVVVMLALAVLFDRSLDPYLERRQSHQDAQLKVEKYKAVLDRQKDIEKAQADIQPAFAQGASRAVRAAQGPAAAEQLVQSVRSALTSLYFDPAEITVKQAPGDVPMGELWVEARFFGVPQQLPRLESTLALSDKELKLKALHLNVVPDPQRGGQQLEIRALIAGLYLRQDEPPAPVPTGAATKPAPKK